MLCNVSNECIRNKQWLAASSELIYKPIAASDFWFNTQAEMTLYFTRLWHLTECCKKYKLKNWHLQECKLTPILPFDLLTSNTDHDPDSGILDLDHEKLVLWPRSIPPKNSAKPVQCVHNLLRYAAKCQFMPYLLTVKNHGKWSRIHERTWIANKNNGWPLTSTCHVLSTREVWWW